MGPIIQASTFALSSQNAVLLKLEPGRHLGGTMPGFKSQADPAYQVPEACAGSMRRWATLRVRALAAAPCNPAGHHARVSPHGLRPERGRPREAQGTCDVLREAHRTGPRAVPRRCRTHTRRAVRRSACDRPQEAHDTRDLPRGAGHTRRAAEAQRLQQAAFRWPSTGTYAACLRAGPAGVTLRHAVPRRSLAPPPGGTPVPACDWLGSPC